MAKLQLSRTLHASLLITGTCVGGGMLALPLWVSQNGFLGACLVMFCCWVFMALSALFILKANSWFPVGTHLAQTAENLLGPAGKWLTWLVYLFIAYASLIAYIAGGSQILSDLLNFKSVNAFSTIVPYLFFSGFCAIILAFGASFLARCNSLFFGLMISFLTAILVLGFPNLQPRDFSTINTVGLWNAFPLFLTSFSFQMIIPTLRSYLKGDDQAVQKSIGIGLSLTLMIYIAWIGFVFTIVPLDGPYSLAEAFLKGKPITHCLMHVIHSSSLSFFVTLFSLFAIMTSFLGISLGLYEFLEDSLNIKKHITNAVWLKILLLTLIFVPSILLAIHDERIFLLALDLSGGIGDTLLNGLIPTAMIVVGYNRKLISFSKFDWHPYALIGSTIFSLNILGMELFRLVTGML